METFFQRVIAMPIHEGKWLKNKLRASSVRQEDFAEKLGITRNTLITLMKEDELSPRYRQTILALLRVSEDELEKESAKINQTGHGNSIGSQNISTTVTESGIDPEKIELQIKVKFLEDQLRKCEEDKERLWEMIRNKN